MKWVRKVYGLFVEDPLLAGLGFVSLLAAFLLSRAGLAELAGLVLFLLLSLSILISVRRR